MVASRTNHETKYFYKLHLFTGGGRWLHREQIQQIIIFINCICSPGGADGSHREANLKIYFIFSHRVHIGSELAWIKIS